MTAADRSGALGGVRVVEVESGVAGAVTGMIFADFGADVVKLESPSGDSSRRHPGSAAWDRGKQSIVVDSEPSRQRAIELIAAADLVITRDSGCALSIDIDDVARRNPSLLVVKTTTFVESAPWRADTESNSLLAAYLGTAHRQSSFDGGPVDPVNMSFLYVHGLLSAVVAVAALIERIGSGHGQVITVPASQAVIHSAAGILSVDPDLDDPATSVGPGGRHPAYTRYESRDGLWLVSGAVGAKFESRLLGALDREGLLADPRMGGDIGRLIAPENLDWLRREIAATFRTRDRDEWLTILPANGIPAGPVNDRDGWLDHPQVTENGLRVDVSTPGGTIAMPGPAVSLESTPGHVAGGAPELGADSAGRGTWEPREAPDGRGPLRKGPLDGITVAAVATFVAAPYAGSVLSELGATVVKVEPTAGDPFRRSAFVYNRGLRCLALDLKSSEGSGVFERLVEQSDIVLTGLRPGIERALGIDHERLRSYRPDVVSVALTGFGEHGPLAGGAAVDLILQGISGLMSAQGGDDDPVVNTSPIVDVTASLLMDLAALLGLHHRMLTGEGQRASVSLTGAATFLQLGELVRLPSGTVAATGGRDYTGPSAFQNYYRASDAWIRVQAESDPPSVAELVHHGLLVENVEPELLRDALAARIRAMPAAVAVELFTTAGLPAVRARTVSEAVRDPELISRGLIHVHSSDDGGYFVTGGSCAIFSRTPRIGILRSPGVGEHTAEILAGLGYDDDQIAELHRAGVVVVGGPTPQVLPPVYR